MEEPSAAASPSQAWQAAPVDETPIAGRCDPAFSAVRDAFAENFVSRGEVGAAVTVYLDGQCVVELAGGWADSTRTRPWQLDTLVNVYSVGKAIIGLLALRAVDAGVISLEDTVASIWPEFAEGGKESATIRHALCHQAGVPAIAERLTNADLWGWETMTAPLARTPAWFEPGSRHTYHANTYGHLVGEIVRRASGAMPGAALRELAAPLDADFFWGVPTSEHARIAELIWAPASPLGEFDPFSLEGEARKISLGYFNPPGYSSQGVVNTPEWRSAQVPATNGHASATGIARLYRALLEPGRLLSTELLAEATKVQSEGFCPVLGEEVSFGLGFTPTTARRPLGPNSHSFGHFGTGGALGFADPDAGIAFGYAMNHVIPRWQSSRNRSLVDALYACL